MQLMQQFEGVPKMLYSINNQSNESRHMVMYHAPQEDGMLHQCAIDNKNNNAIFIGVGKTRSGNGRRSGR